MQTVGDHFEDTGEIVFEDSGEGEARFVETVPEGLDLGSGQFPRAIFRKGRVFRLRRREIVSRIGEPTHLRVIYTAAEERRR
jgi:hypothetical protein